MCYRIEDPDRAASFCHHHGLQFLHGPGENVVDDDVIVPARLLDLRRGIFQAPDDHLRAVRVAPVQPASELVVTGGEDEDEDPAPVPFLELSRPLAVDIENDVDATLAVLLQGLDGRAVEIAVDLGTDMVPALALGVEKAEPGIMERPPRRADERILPAPLLRLMFFQGSIVAISTLAAFAIEFFSSGDIHRAQAEAFATSILAQNVQSFNVRSNRLSVFQLGLFSNRFLVGAFALVVITLLGLIYIPQLQPIFQTVPLALGDWTLIGMLALLPLVVMEIYKFYLRASEPLPARQEV